MFGQKEFQKFWPVVHNRSEHNSSVMVILGFWVDISRPQEVIGNVNVPISDKSKIH